MKRIAFILPTMEGGGMARVLQMIVNNLSDEEYDKYVIVMIKDRPINLAINAKVVTLTEEGRGITGKISAYFLRKNKLEEIKQFYNFDYTISFGPSANLLNIITRYKEKVIVSEHNNPTIEHSMQGFVGKIYDLMTYTYRWADSVIAVSSNIKKDLIDSFGIKEDKIKVIYNGLDLNYIREEAKKDFDTSFMDGYINLVDVAGLTKSKGMWHLIKILPDLVKRYKRIQLILIGEGKLRSAYDTMAKKLGVEKNLKLLGYQKNPFPIIKKSNIFVFPSLYEGFSMAFLEAMSLGVPVISTDCISGPREVLLPDLNYNDEISDFLLGEYGIICPRFSDDRIAWDGPISKEEIAMKNAIIKLLDSSDLQDRYSRCSIRRCLDYTVQRMVDEYKTLLT